MTLVGSGKNAVDEELNPRYGLGPDEWLAYLASARFVLTDSLHGTLFSQIFRKDYYCFKRFEETDKRSQNSRVESLASSRTLKIAYSMAMKATCMLLKSRGMKDVCRMWSHSSRSRKIGSWMLSNNRGSQLEQEHRHNFSSSLFWMRSMCGQMPFFGY